MLSAVVVVDEGGDLGFKIAREEIVLQQDAVLEGLVPALDLALGHWMIGRAAQVFDLPVGEPFGEITCDIAGAVVGQPSRPLQSHGSPGRTPRPPRPNDGPAHRERGPPPKNRSLMGSISITTTIYGTQTRL